MKKLLAGLLLNAIIPISSVAQLSLVKATAQGWAGGAYGHSGCNYFMILKSGAKVSMDSVYINNIGYALTYNPKGYGNLSFDSVTHKYMIRVTESHTFTRNYNYNPDENGDVKVVKPPPPPPVRHFDGKALIVYHYNGEIKFFIVNEFSYSPRISYP